MILSIVLTLIVKTIMQLPSEERELLLTQIVEQSRDEAHRIAGSLGTLTTQEIINASENS
jgi:HPt (histidine-containing phosphotransfer) domain-containing protein